MVSRSLSLSRDSSIPDLSSRHPSQRGVLHNPWLTRIACISIADGALFDAMQDTTLHTLSGGPMGSASVGIHPVCLLVIDLLTVAGVSPNGSVITPYKRLIQPGLPLVAVTTTVYTPWMYSLDVTPKRFSILIHRPQLRR